MLTGGLFIGNKIFIFYLFTPFINLLSNVLEGSSRVNQTEKELSLIVNESLV